jgi:endonuclease VIII
MPEGPSLVILREETKKFAGKKVLAVSGNSKADIMRMKGKKLNAFRTWGKHFLICFDNFTVRIHFMLFGSYSIDEKKPGRLIRTGLKFKNGELNFYACSVKIIETPLDEVYDWSSDIMNPAWDPGKARNKLKMMPKTMVADAILDQSVFAGAGNIFKNEVLFRIRVHPESKIGKLPLRKLRQLISETRNYAFDFLKWKKAYVLRKHWQAHTKITCPRCKIRFTKKHIGKTQRRSFFCNNCQKLYK